MIKITANESIVTSNLRRRRRNYTRFPKSVSGGDFGIARTNWQRFLKPKSHGGDFGMDIIFSVIQEKCLKHRKNIFLNFALKITLLLC